MINLLDIKKDVQDTMRKAGEILLSFFGTALTKRDKEGSGFVTEADVASEKFLIEYLSAILPQASIFAEESGETHTGNSEYCWVIDPLDGTTNFAHGLSYFCISVALTYKGEPVLGCIYCPTLKEMFYAQKDAGAFLNDNAISVSSVSSFDESFLAIGVPYRKDDAYLKRFITAFSDIMGKSFAFRHFGAAALDLAYVACGRFDAIFFEDLAWWDFAAGKLLIKEAGGVITDYKNNEITAASKSLIGASGTVHQELLNILLFD